MTQLAQRLTFDLRGSVVVVVVVIGLVDNVAVGQAIDDEDEPPGTMVGISPPPVCERQLDITRPQMKIIDRIGIIKR